MEDTELQTVDTELPAEEEKLLLSNACEYNETHLAEAVRQQMKQTRRIQNLLLGATLILLLIFSVVSWFREHQTRYLVFGGVAVFMGLFLLYMLFILPGKSGKAQEQKIREKTGGIDFRTVFRPEGIGFINPTGKETTTVPYRMVDKAVPAKDMILLFTADKQMILLDAGRFENGTEEDFWNLLREERPSALPKDRKA